MAKPEIEREPRDSLTPMPDDGVRPEQHKSRERRARILGATVALAVAVTALLTIGAPALIVAAVLGYGAYRLAGGGRV